MGQDKSEKHRERISRGVKRSWELRRARLDTSKGRPAHVDRPALAHAVPYLLGTPTVHRSDSLIGSLQ